jgi:hypothetical protein
MHNLLGGILLCLLGLFVGCSQPTPSPQPEYVSKASESAIPPEILKVAQSVLGSEAEVLTSGDLVRTGQAQALVVNRLKKTPQGVVPGILITRAAIVASEGGKWAEVFRCDEHLKNTKGFLSGTPVAPVTGWRLQYEQSPEKGLILFFSPLQQPAGGYIQTISVRWNPKVKRYQSLDRSYQQFLGEVPTLERIGFDLRR